MCRNSNCSFHVRNISFKSVVADLWSMDDLSLAEMVEMRLRDWTANNIMEITRKYLRLAEHVARAGKMRNVCKFLVENP
jgi:hypothetical protein